MRGRGLPQLWGRLRTREQGGQDDDPDTGIDEEEEDPKRQPPEQRPEPPQRRPTGLPQNWDDLYDERERTA